MKNLVIILTFLCFWGGILSNAAARSSCSGLKVSPEIKVSTSFGQLRYDFSLNTDQITRLKAQNGYRESGLFIHGLATLTVHNEYEVGVKRYPLDWGKGYCIVPVVVNIFVGYETPRIYISNELEPDSCRYNLVLLHEQTHQRINIATLKYFLPIFEKAAAKIVKNMKPVKITSKKQIDKAVEEITKEFSDKFDKVVDLFVKELAIEQGKLDNNINYSMETKLCREFNSKKRQQSR